MHFNQIQLVIVAAVVVVDDVDNGESTQLNALSYYFRS